MDRASYMNKTKKRVHKLSKVFIYIFLILLTIICVLPFYFMMINATRSNSEIVRGISLLPGASLVDNYKTMSQDIDIWRGLRNSGFIAISYTALSAYFSALTAYGFAIYKFRGRKILFGIILVTMMVPIQLNLIGYYELNSKLNLIDTYFPLIIPAIANAMTVFFIKQYIEANVPLAIVDAARIDGANELKIFHRVILPIISPAIATMSIFNFVYAWNNYIQPLVLLFSNEKYPLPVLIGFLRGSAFKTDFGALYLAVAISVLPIIIAYILFSKYIIKGVTMGSVKE